MEQWKPIPSYEGLHSSTYDLEAMLVFMWAMLLSRINLTGIGHSEGPPLTGRITWRLTWQPATPEPAT